MNGTDSFAEEMHYLVHDIGPLVASMEYILELLNSGKFDAAKASHQRMIKEAGIAAKYSRLLLDNITSLARERDSSAIRTELIEWDNLIKDISSFVIPFAEQKNIQFAHRMPQGLRSFSDYTMVFRIIVNLTLNSIKYGPKGTEVNLGIENNGDHILVVITDNGPGIADEFLPHIFEREKLIELRAGKKFHGVGQGLIYCHKTAERLGGSLSLEHNQPTGVKARFILPQTKLNPNT